MHQLLCMYSIWYMLVVAGGGLYLTRGLAGRMVANWWLRSTKRQHVFVRKLIRVSLYLTTFRKLKIPQANFILSFQKSSQKFIEPWPQ